MLKWLKFAGNIILGLLILCIGQTLSADSIPEPEILSVNVVDSRVIGGGKAQYQCDLLDTTPETRVQKLKAQMETDQQWQAQVEHAEQIIFCSKSNCRTRNFSI